jgi:hypothetical protein
VPAPAPATFDAVEQPLVLTPAELAVQHTRHWPSGDVATVWVVNAVEPTPVAGGAAIVWNPSVSVQEPIVVGAVPAAWHSNV